MNNLGMTSMHDDMGWCGGERRCDGVRRRSVALTRWALRCLISLISLAVIVDGGEAFAVVTTYTWSGGGTDNNWNTTTNWTNLAAPPSNNNTAILFTGSTRTSSTNNIGGATFRGITFDANAAAFTLSGSAFTLTNVTNGFVNNSSNLQTVNLAGITLAINNTVFNSGTGGMTVSSPISGNFSINANPGITQGSGTLTFSGSNSFNGLTVGGGVMRATTIANALGNGTLTLGGGNLELANDTGLAFNRNTTVTTSGTIFSERLNAGAGVTHTLGTLSIGALTLTLDTDSSVNSGTAGLTFGTVTLSAAGATFISSATNTLLTLGAIGGNTFSFTVGGAGNTNITGAITTTSGALTKTGTGTLTLSAANTYTGTTSVRAGTLSISATNNLGAATTPVTLGDAATVGTLSYTGTSVNFTRGFTVAAGGGRLDVTQSGSTFTITTGSIGGTGLFTVGGAGNVVVSSTIQGVSGLTMAGSGTLTLSAANTYGGTTTVNSGVLRFGNSNVLSSSNSLSVAGGTVNLSTFSDSLSGVTLSSGTILGSGTLSSTANYTTTSGSIGAPLGGAVGLVQGGAGVTILSGSNSFSGTTAIQSGTISVASVLPGAVNQPLGTNARLDLGVAGTSSGRLLYTGGSGTLSKNVFALGNGTDTIQNAGSGNLTLSGTLTKNGTVLRLQGGSAGITVTGTIVGSLQNSDLAVQNGLTTLSANNTYTGPTFVNSSGTLALGVSNAIPSNSAVTLGGSDAGGNGGSGVLSMGSFTNQIGALAFSGSGGTIRMVPTASATSTVVLSATGAVVLNGAPSTLDLTGFTPSPSIGLYKLIAGTTLTSTFATVTGATDPNFVLRYGTVTPGAVDLQQKANQNTTFTMTTANSRALANTNVAVSGTVTNTSPVNSTGLTLGLTSTGLIGSGFTTGTVSPGTSLAVSGTLAVGATVGPQAWSITNTDPNAITTTSTATGSLTVVDQRTFTTSTSTLALGFVHQGVGIASPSLTVTSTGLNAVTANATVGSFTGGPSGFALGLTSGSAAFLGASASQSTTYTISGTGSTLGVFSGTFSSAVTPEFGTIPNLTVAVTGSVYSGQSTWAVNGGGNWGTLTGTGADAFGANWGASQGSPGLDAAAANIDTATFGSALTGGTAAINTNGAIISLKSLTFANAAGSYAVYQTGGSGPLTLLAAGTNAAGLTVSSGSHAIHADVTLGSNTVVDVATGGFFTFHNNISGSAAHSLTKTGAGTLFFDGNSSYAGNTNITQGMVSLLSGVTPLGSGTVTVSSGATLDLNFRTITNPLTILTGGIVLNTGTGQSVTVSDYVLFSGTTNGTVNVVSGGTAAFQSLTGALVTVNSGGAADFTGSATGTPSVSVLGGGRLTVAGTAAGSYTVAGTGTFGGPLTGSLDVSSGGVVAFNGGNAAGSTFNVASGGLVNVGSAATIGGQLHVSGTAAISGTVTAGAGVLVQSGGMVRLLDGAVFSQPSLSNAGTLVVDRTSALTLSALISGSGGLQKAGSGVLTVTAANTFTGPTSLTGGTLLLNGSLSSPVATSVGTTLGGSGTTTGALSGAGLVSPGNSPGILTASAFDPTGGLDAAFEFTAFTPTYASSGTGALSDVLRLTGTSPFLGSLLTNANVIDVYFNVASIATGQTFDGGFFTGQTSTQLLNSVQGGSFQYWLMTTGSGTRTFNGVNYAPLFTSSSGVTGVRVQATDLTVNFGAGDVTGSITEFVTVSGSLAKWTGLGGNGNWSTAANWSSPVTTSGTYDLVFGGTNQASGFVVTTNNNLGTVNVDSITFTNSGTLAAGQNAFFTIGGGTLALNNSLITTAPAAGGVFITNSDGDTISAPITLAGTSSFVLNNNHNLSISGAISGTGGLIIDDGSVGTTEYVFLSGSNSYSGGTLIKGGFANTSNRGNPGSSNNSAFGTGPVTVQDNGTLLLRNNSVASNPLTVSGSGSGLNPANNSPLVGSFGVAGGVAEYAGPITLAGNARFATASSASGDTTSKLLVSGNVDIGPYLLTLRSRPSNVGGSTGMFVEITGTIFGSGGVNVESLDALGRALISGSNSYSGGTTVTTGTLMVGNGRALGTGFLAVNTSALDLNGQTLLVGALSGSSTGVIRTGISGAAQLVTTSTTDSTYAGRIVNGAGTVSLTKAGSGVLSLTGSNTYSGTTNIDGGVLALDSLYAIDGGGPITFGGGTLRYSAVNQVDYSAQFANSTAPISIDTNGQIVAFWDAIANTNLAGLTKTGSGTLFLNAANQYVGTTTVNAGILAGTGSVLGPLSVAAGAVFDPGSGPGSTTIFGVGGFSQATGGTTRMQVTGTTAGSLYDQALFSGTSTTVSWGGTLDLTLSGSYANFTTFDLFKGFTTQSGNLDGITFAAGGSPYDGLAFSGPVAGVWRTAYGTSGQYVTFNQTTGVLMIVPEPGAMTLAAAGCGIAGVLLLRRRRSSRRADA